MVPLQIKLRNFLSYGAHTQTINFEPYHLICLSGKNGHGKSALLDAMTWVLWGHARKTSGTAKADEGLLRLGQTHMMVSFDFICNKKKYRVQREFVVAQHRTCHTELHFGLVDEQGLITSLNEKTTRATQQKIIDTLGLDYDSCINSIFLRQGQSNEFSNKSAKERKEILATILGINRYELLRSKALEKVKEHTSAQEKLVFMTQHLQDALAQKNSLQSLYTEINNELTSKLEQEELLKKEHQRLLQKSNAILEQKHQLNILRFQQKQIHELFSQKSTDLHHVREALRAMRKDQQTIARLMHQNEQQKLFEQQKNLEQQRQELGMLKELCANKQLEFARLTQKLTERYHEELSLYTATAQQQDLELKKIKSNHEELIKNGTSLEEQLKTIERELNTYQYSSEELTKIIETNEKSIERKKQFYHTFIAQGNAKAQELKELEGKLLLAESANPVACPLCEQSLSSSRKKLLHERFNRRAGLLAHQKNRLLTIVPQLKNDIINLHNHTEILKKQREAFNTLQAQHQELIKNCTIIKEKKNLIHDSLIETEKKYHEAQLKALAFKNEQQRFFQSQENYKELECAVVEVQHQINHHSYNAAQHEHINNCINLLQRYEHQANTETYALNKKEFTTVCSELRVLQQQQKNLEIELQKYASLEEEESAIKQQLSQSIEQQHQVAHTVLQNVQKKGALEQQLTTIAAQEHEFAAHSANIKLHEIEINDYQNIAQAFSKNGIQALVIESAIPELEQEANTILSKLTDNQSHIIIESVRDLKSGGYKETLDIKISDAVGTRPYELFSGGEAFRIDFALRIALSKLLARRSGTSLQTLIIDEGFGSQDEEGLSRIMDALYKIQDDFAKIIIVSHLTEMKNQFPTHFVVQKHSTGSQITVLEQG